MFIEAKKIIGMPVAAMDAEARVGTVQDLVIDPSSGALLGLAVKTIGLFGPVLILSAIDILEWDPNGVVTKTSENMVPAAEIVRVNAIIKKKIHIIGLPAKTESGKSLGSVENLLLDTNLNIITKYYLKDIILGTERVIPSDKVVKIGKVVIFTDDSALVPTGLQNVTA